MLQIYLLFLETCLTLLLIENKIVEKYSEVFDKIQISLPINYSPVMELVIRMAKHEQEKGDSQNFYSLI